VEIAASPRVLLAEIAVVVILSYFFEAAEHSIRRKFARTGSETGAEILNTLFKEITVLGFVAFVIFLVTHTGAADILAPKFFTCDRIYTGGHNTLSATFETVHMMIFMLLVVLLAQAAAMYLASERIAKRWIGYERAVGRSTGNDDIESKLVQSGYLSRIVDNSEPSGFRLEQKRAFSYGSNWIQRVFRRSRPLQKLIMWRAIRHEFLFPRTDSGRDVKRVPDPSLFSFTEYLKQRMGKIVTSLCHVDRTTWFVTLVLLAAPLYLYQISNSVVPEAVQCVIAWGIAGVGLVMATLLERETYRLTPIVPQDSRNIVRLFSGDSFQMLRRVKLPGLRDRPEPVDEGEDKPRLGVPEAVRGRQRTDLSSKGFMTAFRILSFVQATSTTALILSHLSAPVVGRWAQICYFVAWLEWPVMLFLITPVIVRRLTIRTSILYEKDDRLIRKVTLETKQSILRDYSRLVQIIGFEARAQSIDEEWTQKDGQAWSRKKSIQLVLLGLRRFDKLSSIERAEIWSLFAAWEHEGRGVADTREFLAAFESMGCERPQEAVDNLLRALDFDGSGDVNWMKFKALFGLATAERPDEEMQEDLATSFKHMNTEDDGELTIFNISDGFKKMNVGVSLDDVANLLFLHFGMAKPHLTMPEFADFIKNNRAEANPGKASGKSEEHH